MGKDSFKYQVWVTPDFPDLLRRLVAVVVQRTGGERVTQGDLLRALVTQALEKEKKP